MPNKITHVFAVPVEVDLDDYALTYGFDGPLDTDTLQDARGHTADLVNGAVDEQLEHVANGSTRIPIRPVDLLPELRSLIKVTSARELHARIRLLTAQLTTPEV